MMVFREKLDKKSTFYKNTLTIFVGVFFLVASAIVLLLFKNNSYVTSSSLRPRAVNTVDTGTKLSGILRAKSIDNNLRFLTKFPHIAGSERNNELGREIARRWKEYGFDKVEMPRYDVLLSQPDLDNPSSVSIVDNTGRTRVQFPLKEKAVLPSEDFPDVSPPFISNTPNGTIVGNIVYANFGREDDFEQLIKMGVSLNGCIAMIRLGILYRGNKVQNAESYGAAGVLIYADPSQFSPEGKDNTFPRSWWLPKTGVQRGAGSFGQSPGDTATYGYPAVHGIYRTPRKDIPKSKTPAHSISFQDALDIFSRLQGPKAPDAWQGGLNITYRVGPGFRDKKTRVKMVVRSLDVKKPIYNVIGTITGSEEPDRYVLLGNHRDAWVFGASDPSSGTAIMMEMSRGLSKLLKTGWRPRRTIKFCSWDAEEQFLTGSTEWVEDNAAILSTRAVVYLNLDIGVGGNFTLNVDGSPLIEDVLISTAREVLDPTSSVKGASMYDVMKERDVTRNRHHKPSCHNLAFGSDYVPFYHYLGVTSGDVSYIFGGMHGIRRSYPTYHSMHDSYYWLKTFVDPNFKIHLAVGQYTSRLLLKFASSVFLPMNPTKYAPVLIKKIQDLKNIPALKKHNIDVRVLYDTAKLFKKKSILFEEARANTTLKGSESVIRALNNQIALLERAFLNTIERSEHLLFNNVIYGPKWGNLYKGQYFPRLHDAIQRANAKGDWESVKKEMSVVLFAIRSAVKVLEPIY